MIGMVCRLVLKSICISGDHELEVIEQVKTDLEIEFDDPGYVKMIIGSIEPEILTAPSFRSSVEIRMIDENTLRLEIEAEDVSSLRASLNSYLRWIMLSYDILKLKK